MAKKSKTRAVRKNSKKHTAIKSKNISSALKTNRWLIISIAILITVAIVYLNSPEDLGPQLDPPPANAIYKLADQPIDARVQDLLSRMTLEEKIGQMALVDKNSLGKIEDISRYYLGGVLSGAGAKPKNNTPQGWREMIESMKEQARKSRLGIPILYGIDANHGHSNVLGATVFPHAIGLGASKDAKLIEAVAAATKEELAATGANWSFSPSLDAPKDIRWGRVYEAFSDDPNLNSILGRAYILGTQTVLNDKTKVLASAKHYLANGAMVWGQSNHKDFKIDQGISISDESALASEYLPPFKSAVDADVASVMVGLNQWGDGRIIDSKYLLTDKLKNDLGFKGFIVSDWYGVYEYSMTSKYKANIKTINAGLDMSMLPYEYKDFLNDVRKAVKNGEINPSRIDDAVSRILYQKFKAGLFDITENSTSLDIISSKEHHQIARQAVASSAVLLKNKSSLIPLPKNIGKILVAGSGADNVGRQSGAWTVEWQGVDGNWMPGGTSVLQGIREVLGNKTSVDYSINGEFRNISTPAKIGIAVVSEKPYAEGLGDNANPTLSQVDLTAIENLKKSSERVIVIILSGRPLIITDEIQDWDAVIAAWLPGSEGGGIADVLFGDKPFTGKLPLPWPAGADQLPITADGTTYNNAKPLFNRNFGL